MNATLQRQMISSRFQKGMSLMEAMISLALSLVVTSAMVVLMANSLGTATRIIQMSQLTDELRNSMSMMTRDVRRANYSEEVLSCFGYPSCDAYAMGDVDVVNNSCFVFDLRRVNLDEDDPEFFASAGGFRRNTVGNVGLIEVWVGDVSPNCAADSADWIPVTDPDFVDVTVFNVDDADSFEGEVSGEAGTGLTQRTRKIQIQLEGRLIRDNTITRRIEDTINVRNDLITAS